MVTPFMNSATVYKWVPEARSYRAQASGNQARSMSRQKKRVVCGMIFEAEVVAE
jgi:hypothetical protein